ncbi:cysteine desulfurase family protein [Clostridium oryzae]|uniref:Cysteine desulfurase IscS n=1 Tax=Clostridium oryzae TaxID=1450648 RepID=A0A1V4ID97_9CLOT|nr:cysteine desulfurase family protein [Clostridium oryzae]OPJ57860.1 cysteine desulfurase IscS [Clostridium oryzae]
MEVYFDNSATTIPYDEVIESVAFAMKNYFANPSSAYKIGMNAERELGSYRDFLASTINATKDELIFTSGGSESNNFLINGFLSPGDNIITTKIEHPSVLNTFKALEALGIETTYINVDSDGKVILDELEAAINNKTKLVSVMHVNNEIGTIQDIDTIGNIVKSKSQKAKFHVDAVQSYGKIDINVKKANIDLLSTSAHKIHGPRGVGFAYIKKGLVPKALIYGGGQEKDFRSGTENLAGAAGFHKAASIIFPNLKQNYKHVTEVKKHFIDGLQNFKDIKINSPLDSNHSPYILNVSFYGLRGEVLLHLLEENSIYVSTGSACSSKNTRGSHVLRAIGLKNDAVEGGMRFSFCEMNTTEQVDYVLSALEKSIKFLRRK